MTRSRPSMLDRPDGQDALQVASRRTIPRAARSRLAPDGVQQRRPRDEAHEAQPGRGLAVGHPRRAVVVEHAEVADERLEPGPVAGRRDHRVRRDALAVGEQDAGVVEGVDPRDDLDASRADRVEDLGVDDHRRDVQPVQAAEDALRRDGQAVRGEVADRPAAHEPGDGIGDRRRETRQRRRERRADRRAEHDVRRRAHREADPCGPALDEVVRDLRAGASGARRRARRARGRAPGER